jgi:uncharacterized protein YggE
LRLLLVFAVLALLAAACGDEDDENSNGAADDPSDTPSITMAGTGRVALEPDIALLTLGVDISRPELTDAQAEARATMEAVIQELRDGGVDEEDIQTSSYAIYTERDYGRTNQPITGFHVVHTVSVTVREIDTAGTLLQATIDAGANNVQGVSFGLEDNQAAVTRARELAVADARGRAEDLARLTNTRLGRITRIAESTSALAPVDRDAGAGVSEDEGVPINPGQTEVSVVVTITWELEE